MELLFIFANFCGGIMYRGMAWGWVTYMFYQWFIVKIFTALPVITYSQAIGLYLFIALFKNYDVPSIAVLRETETESRVGRFVTMQAFLKIVTPWIVLFSGWLLKFTVLTFIDHYIH